MCLVFSVAFAIIFFAVCKVKKNKKLSATNEFTVALVFSSASLMWCVDSIFSVVNGDCFLDLSKSDFVLGLIVSVCGLLLYGILYLRTKLLQH